MLKWLNALYHRLTSSSAGVAISKLKEKAEADYAVAISDVERAYRKDIAVVTDFAHKELDALEHLVASAHARMTAVMEAGVDLGIRNNDAFVLHTDLTRAVS